MVSDTPSQPPKNEKHDENAVTPADEAGREAGTPPVAPEENDAAVKTAMADVAAAIKRHEEHGAEETPAGTDSETDETAAGDDKPETASGDGNAAPPPPPPADETPQGKRGPGIGAFLAAGVAGGIIALAGAAALSYAGLLGPLSSSSDGLEDELASLRQEITALKSGDQSNAVSSLQSDLSALKSQVENLSSGSDSSDSVAALQQQVAKLQSTVQSDASRLQSLAQENETLKSDIGSAQQTMQQKLTALEQKVNTPGKDLAVARAIAAAGLKSAIDRGQNFETALSTYAQVAPQGTDLSALKSLAASGVPTREALTEQFSSIANSIIAAADQPPPDTGIFDRLVDSAKGLVNVRPVGDVEGDSTPAIVARIENNLKLGNLEQAEQEWQTLPEDAKTVSADFENALSARIKADALVSETLSSALGSTAGAPAAAPQSTPAN
ncbi:mitofilin family membrane protein [uncultured Martelella sp.]|uniref:COG4223 family protein n=1 Tax=uncultured Martelella sp. TaxID=392331 RepID=UPI0029C66409|nr:mitofilin family membrane protein [uncultured Martelella sp.]